ncbi:MAG: hypothetical protein M1524_00785, partial [Patescibacteria group bacterium]|nr:hypothetical protein [Patescibacteria group bacterium]
MKKIYIGYFILFITLAGIIIALSRQQKPLVNPLSAIKEKPFEKYSLENLKKSTFKDSPITFGDIIKDTPD